MSPPGMHIFYILQLLYRLRRLPHHSAMACMDMISTIATLLNRRWIHACLAYMTARQLLPAQIPEFDYRSMHDS